MKKLSLALTLLSFFSVLFAQSINNEQISSINSLSKPALNGDYNISADELLKSVQIAMSNPDYMVTAGDVYNLSYAAGNTPISYNIAVDSSYKVRISNLAVLDAKGKTFVELKNAVETIVSKNYPLSGVQFVLTSPSTFKVAITGEISKTIEANAWSLTRISTFLNYPGLTEFASRRFITVTSSSGESHTYDLFKAERYGDMSQNPYVRPGDIININRIDRQVSIIGAVERPGSYELKNDENLKDLVEYYGHGLKPLADISRIQIKRHVNATETTGENFYITDKEINENFKLVNLDQVTISTFEKISSVIYFEGAVFNSSGAVSGTSLDTSSKFTVRINDNTNYAFLIRDYSYFFMSPESDLQNAYVKRGEEVIPLNIEKVLYDSTYYSDFTAQANDTLVVPFRQFFVSVAGSVVSPGRYPYIPNRTYEYYIGLAGGFDKDKNTGNSVRIVTVDGKNLKQTAYITPECTITAKTNAVSHYILKYSTLLATIASLLTTILNIIMLGTKFGTGA